MVALPGNSNNIYTSSVWVAMRLAKKSKYSAKNLSLRADVIHLVVQIDAPVLDLRGSRSRSKETVLHSMGWNDFRLPTVTTQ
jgi:hypothetical protein